MSYPSTTGFGARGIPFGFGQGLKKLPEVAIRVFDPGGAEGAVAVGEDLVSWQPVVKLAPRSERAFSARSALENLARSRIFLRFSALI
jgi:hypothetical protein